MERPGFPNNHPIFRGQYAPGHPLVPQADLLVFLGARLFNEFEPAQVRRFRRARRVHSHADPVRRDGDGVDAGLVGDQRLLIEARAAALPP